MRDKLKTFAVVASVLGGTVGIIALYIAGVIGFFALLTWVVLWVLRSQGVV